MPVIPLFPLKLVGLWLLAHEHWLAAAIVIVAGKFVGLGVTAFIFDVTRAKLLEMTWFRKIYHFILVMRARAAALVNRTGRGTRLLQFPGWPLWRAPHGRIF